MSKVEFKGARNLFLENVFVQYTKVSKPVMYKGVEQWETSIITDDSDIAQMWEDNHLNVRGTPKMKPVSWTVSLNRKTKTKDGTEQDPVRVVDAQKRPLSDTDRRRIGNNSVANLILWQGEYDNEWGSGVTTSLTAIQITDLVPYEGGMQEMDFDSFGADGDKEMAKGTDGKDVDLF